METYRNSYKKNEDVLLWELHEVRHRLHEENKGKSVEEINREALQKFTNWGKGKLTTVKTKKSI